MTTHDASVRPPGASQTPFRVTTDPQQKLGPLRLPTFEIAGLTLYKRITLVAENARIVEVDNVLRWLQSR